MTLTLHDTGTIGLTNIVVTVTAPFSRPAAPNAGTCTATLAGNAGGTTTCTIFIVYNAPATAGASNGTVTITANQNGTPVTITGSPVAASGTAVAPTRTATLTPTTRAYGTVARGSTTGPSQLFTYTNTGNVNLTVGDGALAGTNPTEFFIVQNATTCGPAQTGRAVGIVTLAPQATCQVTVQFRPTTALAAGAVRNATISVSATGATTQTSTLSGTGSP
jgi:hypothetical protein